MKLYNCYSQEGKDLQDIDLDCISSVDDILDLANKIKAMFDDCKLEDEIIVTDALHQIIMELGKRLQFEERSKDSEKYKRV